MKRACVITLLPLLGMLSFDLIAPASAEERVQYSNSIKPVALEARVAGPRDNADSGERIEFMLALKMRDFDALQKRIDKGEIISFDELAAKYYPLASDYQAQADWLTAQGLTIVKTDPCRLGITISGTAAQIETALQTVMARVNADGSTVLSAVTPPSLPAGIASAVLGINGLQPHIHPHKHLRPTPSTSNHAPFLTGEILKAYNANGLGLTGAGQKIGIVIDTFPKNSDLTSFWNASSVPQSLNNMEFVQVVNGTLPSVEGEETLDVEWSSGIASGAKVRVYATTDLSFVHLDQAYQAILNDLPTQTGLRQVSISLGLGEAFASVNQMQTDAQYFASMAAAGVTVFVSSGDGGSSPGPNGHDHSGPIQTETPASDPNVTAVGGTSLFLTANTGAVNSESAWFDGGGAVSIVFNRPAYQVGSGLPGGTKRCVPDVASAGDPDTGCLVVLNGQSQQFGGTSWSAPMWAGFCALINQARANGGMGPVGALGPKIYPMLGTSNFRDITTGSNGNNGNFNAGANYDLCTGVGVPNVGALVQSLATTTGGGGGGQPNLTFDSAVGVTSPATVSIGATMNLSSGVINSDTGAAGAFTVRYRLSTNNIYDATDTFLGDAAISAGLAANGKANASVTVTCPNVTPGSYFLVWSIDVLGEVTESNENDNQFFALTPIVVTPAGGMPNLTLDQNTSISTPSSVAIGANLAVSANILNNGNGSAGAFSVRYRLSKDTTYSPSSDTLLGDATVAGIGANATAAASFSGICPNITPGAYFLVFSIDPFGDVSESNEADNIGFRAVPITVTANAGQPNLTLDQTAPITIPATVMAGGPLTISTSVVNDGVGATGAFVVRYRLSGDTKYDSTDTLIGDANINSLSAGASAIALFDGTCPNVTPGDYFLVWFIDVFGDVTESTEADNLGYFTTKITVTAANNKPTITSAPSFDPPAPIIGQTVTFSVAAGDIDNDPLTIAWNFGDGNMGNGTNPTHIYDTPGTYTVTVSVSDGRGGTASAMLDIDVHPAFKLATLTKKKFILNFRTGTDAIDVTFSHADFKALPTDAGVVFSIGSQPFDAVTLFKGKGTGMAQFGRFTLNTRSGTLRYAVRNTTLQNLLAAFGVQNTTVKNAAVQVPLFVTINGAGYGDTYNFSFTGKADRTGTGK